MVAQVNTLCMESLHAESHHCTKSGRGGINPVRKLPES